VRESERVYESLVAIRRDLHAHPEIGNAEYRTTHRIVEILTGLGLEPEVLSLGTGAICDILPEGHDTGDGLIGLRADIDALPIADGKDVPYASTNPGVCHACGHDVHTTVVLGVGHVLARLRREGRLPTGVRLFFQPAEETSPGGAVDAIDAGVLKDVTEVYALHCDPRTDAGQVALKEGPITSAVDRVRIRLSGGGGHTSRPHLTADLIGALSEVATTVPLLLTRRVDPRGGVSLIWGRITAGSAGNAIPGSGELEGTLRALDANGWRAAQALVPELVAQVAAPYGVRVAVEVTEGVPPAVNHAEGIDRLAAAAEAMFGSEAITTTEQSLGGEDFSWMLQRVPGALARLGVRTPGALSTPDIHQPTFTVDERCIRVGVQVLSELVTAPPEAAVQMSSAG